MTTPETVVYGAEPTPLPARNWKNAMKRGLSGACPHCGEGRIFSSFLKVAPACTACGEAFDGHRADDLPAYATIFIVGHIVVPLNLMVERGAEWPLWLHVALWPMLALILAGIIIQPVKGALVGLQWALRLHGFDPEGDIHDVPVAKG